jgi:hypothetical protein
MDELERDLLYCCTTEKCDYHLCLPCVRRAFQDATGESYRRCPMCKTPMARDILHSIVGRGGVKAVEDDLRQKVEFDLETRANERDMDKSKMKGYNERAVSLFNKLAESLNLKCPRCHKVFYDYSGCNALTCSNVDCKAAFCAVCLEDCGNNSHPHVRENHGNYFDKTAFETAKKEREVTTVKSFMSNIATEPYEVCQLVKNLYANSIQTSELEGSNKQDRARSFVAEAKGNLIAAVRNDRLGVLKDPSDFTFNRRGLSRQHISPRCMIPDEYKLQLIESSNGERYTVSLYYSNEVDLYGRRQWAKEDLHLFDDSIEKDRRRVDALVNIVQSLKCAVLAFDGSLNLYQTKFVGSTEGRSLADDQVSICLLRVTNSGEVDLVNSFPVPDSPIIGINQNQRLMLLEKHVSKSEESDLLFDALSVCVGSGSPSQVFDNIDVPAPSTFDQLNEQQKKVAHPLALMTATTVAGPPGTGKTKTITELVRCILECTSANALVLSERNGAIDAIAEKFVRRCLKIKSDGIHGIKDIAMWENLVVYGSRGGLGPSAKLFTLEEKLR